MHKRAPTQNQRPLLCALGLALGPMVALGLARFAYSLLLPAMRTDLSWSYGQAGTMNTANAVGYLAGALAAAPVTGRVGTRRVFAAGMVLAAAALLGAGLTESFALQLLLRLAAGLGAAGTFISGAALMARLGDRAPGRSGALLAVYTAGAGVGIVVSGFLVQPILITTGSGGWHLAWITLAGLATASALGAWPALRRVDEPAPRATSNPHRRPGWVAELWLPALGYLLFGAGYIAYVTFVIAYLHHIGFTAGEVTAFWTLLGLTVLAGVPLWGWLLDRLRSGHALALMNLVLAAGSLLPLLFSGTGGGLASAVIFGSAFLAVPAGMAHLARRQLPATAWMAAIGGLTVAFAIGQSIGPALAGLLADQHGGAALGLLLAVATLGTAALAYLASETQPYQRPQHRRTGTTIREVNRREAAE
ncbi:MAG TPA: YbfB/YjiJ family MFS transporter [Segeticoccus sp.]|nr:YbfB/YjiJ family MFS transporter [Segeticoccus sp.]